MSTDRKRVVYLVAAMLGACASEGSEAPPPPLPGPATPERLPTEPGAPVVTVVRGSPGPTAGAAGAPPAEEPPAPLLPELGELSQDDSVAIAEEVADAQRQGASPCEQLFAATQAASRAVAARAPHAGVTPPRRALFLRGCRALPPEVQRRLVVRTE